MLDTIHHFATRRKKNAPPLVDTAGAPLAVQTQPRSWCRVKFEVSLVPPKNGGVFFIERGPWTRRLVVYVPRAILIAATVAAFGNVSWLQKLLLQFLSFAK